MSQGQGQGQGQRQRRFPDLKVGETLTAYGQLGTVTAVKKAMNQDAAWVTVQLRLPDREVVIYGTGLDTIN